MCVMWITFPSLFYAFWVCLSLFYQNQNHYRQHGTSECSAEAAGDCFDSAVVGRSYNTRQWEHSTAATATYNMWHWSGSYVFLLLIKYLLDSNEPIYFLIFVPTHFTLFTESNTCVDSQTHGPQLRGIQVYSYTDKSFLNYLNNLKMLLARK